MDQHVFYALHHFLETHLWLKKPVIFCAAVLPWILAVCYVAGGFFLLISRRAVNNYFLGPALAFILVTALRKIINRPRPFEVYGIASLVSHGKGESFPSRHTASALIIAFALGGIWPFFRPLFFTLACLVALSRLLTGVHYLTDVLAGAAISLFIGLWLLA